MSIDWFTLDALVRELRPKLAGARLDKIHQPGRERLLLRLWNGRETLRLVLDLSPGAARLHLTPHNEVNPPQPPRFCQLLRARLRRIESLALAADDRILDLGCRGPAGEPYRLLAELTGVRTDLVLVDAAGRVVDALRRQDDDRELRPGASYLPPSPPAGMRLDDPALPAALAAAPAPVAPWLLHQVRPMTPALAELLAQRLAAGEGAAPLLAAVNAACAAGRYHTAVQTVGGKRALVTLPQLEAEPPADPAPSVSDAVQACYGEGEVAPVADARQRWRSLVRKALARCERRLRAIATEAQQAQQADSWQRWGQLLLANRGRLQRGQSRIELEDWFATPPVPVEIPLDPKLTPQENIDRYFTRARKFHRGDEHRQRRQQETAAEMAWLEQLLLALDEAASGDELQLIRGELEQARLLPPAGRRSPKVRPRTEQLRRGRTPGGWALAWGTNNRLNDLLLRQVAKPHDLWFHVHNIPGSHVVLQRRPEEEVPEVDRLYAAAVAAGYSRARDDARVEVQTTEVRQLKFIKGGASGQVIVQRFATLRVAPIRPAEGG